MKREMTFENFYVYEGNKVAYLAAKKIVDFSGELFNPLYVYGSTGIGKTHLLWALFTELKRKENALFYPAKEFEKYLSQAKIHDSPIFVDDIHIINRQYHEQLLSVIDTLLAANKQICFSGNVAPRELKDFDVKLLSRLEGGLVCDIASPKEMALIDMIKKKSGEAGILLPDEIVVELAQLSTGSIRTIEGIINRLVAYSSLGDVMLDVNTVRMILKEFYPKGIYSPVASLLEELKKNASEVLEDVSERLDKREEYKEKIYIWEMKGFDTSRLKPLLDGDIGALKQEYDSFIKQVERLIALQREFGSLDTREHPDDAMKVESMLFSPEHVEDIKELMKKLKETKVFDKAKSFDTYLVGECNNKAVQIYKEQVAENLGDKYNPFIIFGAEGTGKTRFLEAVEYDLSETGKEVRYTDLTRNTPPTADRFGHDVLILDNYHVVLGMSEDERMLLAENLEGYVNKGIPVIISAEPFSSDTQLTDKEKALFEKGIEVELSAPDNWIVEDYIKSKVGEDVFEQLLDAGIPKFDTFDEIHEFLEKPAEKPAEIVPLGLAGEEEEAEELVSSAELQKEVEEQPELEGESVPISAEEEEQVPEHAVEAGPEAAESAEEVVTLGLPGEEVEEKIEEAADEKDAEEEIIPDEEESKEEEKIPEEQGGEEEAKGTEGEKGEYEVTEEPEEEEEIVQLGFGEEEREEPVQVVEQEAVVQETKEEQVEPEPDTLKGRILKIVRDERFIMKEIPNELIEDNY